MKSKKHLILIAIIATGITLAVVVSHMVRVVHRALLVGNMGTLPSILAYVYVMDIEQPQALNLSLSEEWTLLSSEQYDTVIEAANKAGKLDDDASKWTKSGKFVDPWGRPYLIAGRMKKDREFLVWSRGPDGLSATEDDIVSPYNSVVPDNLKSQIPNK